jgi:transcriptional regulator with XRE-family HTH domain
MQELGQLIRDIRGRIAALSPVMSREQIAPKLGVTYSWLSQFMRQNKPLNNPRVRTLEKVINGLDRLEKQ